MTTKPPSVALATAAHAAELVPDEVVEVSPLVRRILAPNPSIMTGPGTNTYLVGEREVTVIDPGPDVPEHVAAIVAAGAARGGSITRIVCTHTHLDHWPAAHAVAAATGAEILAFDARDGLEATGTLADGDELVTDAGTLEILWTPGHASNHLCVLLREERLLFTGDHIMQGVTVVIAPPDGDMTDYMASLRRLRDLDPPLERIAPAHGHVIDDPAAVIDAYLAHRTAREELVSAALAAAGRAVTVDELVAEVYADVDPAIHPIARLSLWAHLRGLADQGRAAVDDRDDIDAGRWTAR